MRRIILLLTGLSLIVAFTGCGGGQIRLLEEQLADEQARSQQLQDENQALAAQLSERDAAYQAIAQQMADKDALLEEQEESLSDMRLQNLELKATLEESGKKQSAAISKAELSGDYQADYEKAMENFKKRWYIQAAGIFRALVQSDKHHALSDNCQYWLGECYYAQKQFENALAEFEKVFAFDNSNKADAAQLKIGLCWLQMGKTEEAKEQLIRLMSSYPSSEFVPRARTILDELE